MSNDQTLDQVVNVDDLLDGTLDDLSDLPEFKLYPEGAHKVKINWEINKEVEWSGKKKKVQEMKCEGLETVELKDATKDQPISAGQVQQFTFDLSNEYSQGTFKMVMAALAERLGAKSPRQLMAESNGFECLIVVKHRTSKEDKTKVYAQLDNLAVI